MKLMAMICAQVLTRAHDSQLNVQLSSPQLISTQIRGLAQLRRARIIGVSERFVIIDGVTQSLNSDAPFLLLLLATSAVI